MNAGRRALTLLRNTLTLWLANDAFQHAGALAFYTLFSLAPLLIIVTAIIGAVFGEEAARGEISSQIGGLVGPQVAEAVEDAVRRSRVGEAGLWPSVLGTAALLLGSTTVFAQMQASLNQFWGVVARPSRSGIVVFLMTRLVSLSLVAVIGFLLLTSFVITTGIAMFIRFAGDWIPVSPLVATTVDVSVSLLIATLLFAMIFKILPDVRLHWRDMWWGAFVTGGLFVAGRSLIAAYLARMAPAYLARMAPASPYGAAGSLVVILMWVYYSSLILLFGAALTRASIRLRGDRIVPKATAVRVKLEMLE